MFSTDNQRAAAAFLSQLIAFDSVSSTSNEAISDYVAEQLRSLGFAVQRHTYRDRAGLIKHNVVARRDPKSSVAHSPTTSKATGLAYFAHTDVVPADRWDGPGGDPFQPVIQDDRLYGRGACDMKGSLACFLAAIATLDHDRQTAPLWMVCTADEEIGFQGANQMRASSPGYRALATEDPIAIIGEPTRLRVVHAHKGIRGFRVHSRGRSAHSSTAAGSNANVAMVPMLQTLLELNQRCKTDPALRDPRFDPPTLTWNFGVSDHATATNVVPDHCVAWVSLRPMPGVDGGELMEIVRRRAEQLGLEYVIESGCEPLDTPVDAECVRQLCQLAQPYNDIAEPQTVCYATDGAVLSELSQRVVCGPGDIAQAHTTDEFIELEQLDRGTRFYADAIGRWCT